MNDAEREWFNWSLAKQIGEIPDSLGMDVGEAAEEEIELARLPRGARRANPGLCEAANALARCWQARGGPLEIGNLHRQSSNGITQPAFSKGSRCGYPAAVMELRRLKTRGAEATLTNRNTSRVEDRRLGHAEERRR